MKPATRMMFDRISEIAARGATYIEAAQEVGSSYAYVAAFAGRHGIKFQLRKRGRPLGTGCSKPSERERDMLKRYTSGETLEVIGKSYGITRERVRQLLSKYYNIRGADGGRSELARKKKRDIAARRNARCIKAYGCSYREYRKLASGADRPTGAYHCQRRNAIARGIGWELSLWQWWKIWQHSGHWSERGRGAGYCMCRLNDAGPYSIDNVYIATGVENIQDYWAAVRSGERIRTVRPRSNSSPADTKAAQRAATERYRQTPKFQLRYQLRRQGLPKEQRDAIVAERFGA